MFELDPASRQIHFWSKLGNTPLRSHFLAELIHSPVRDVAEDKRAAVVRNAQDAATRRFLHLKPLLDFESCVGVSVPARLRNQYALFAFFARSNPLSDATLARTEAAAALIGAWLERRQFIKQTADLNRIAVLGQLGRALVHEISGRLTPST